MVLDLWGDKALCYENYPVFVNDKKYVVDIAVFVYKKPPVRKVAYALYDRTINISQVLIFDKKSIERAIAYLTSTPDDATKEDLEKIFDEVETVDVYDLIEYYKERVNTLTKLVKGEILPLFGLDQWYHRMVQKPKRSEKLLQIRANTDLIDLFNKLKAISGVKTSQQFLLWLMWKASLCYIYELLENQ